MRSASRLERHARIPPYAPSVLSLSPIGAHRQRPEPQNRREHMNSLFLKFYLKLQDLTHREEGQDLVEYALLVSLIALAAITGVSHIASAVTTVFSNISASLA
jgi:pilus assembly protein Flp/PilA